CVATLAIGSSHGVPASAPFEYNSHDTRIALPSCGRGGLPRGEPGEMADSTRVRIRSVQLLSDDWYVLKKTTFDYLRRDGTWQTQRRETYDRGDGAAILLFNRDYGTVFLIRQFRFPAYVNGLADGMLVEVCAGLLDKDGPEECIRREAEEETGFEVRTVRKVFQA